MVTATPPTKAQKRELPRWARVLRMRESGMGISALAAAEDISTSQVYYLLSRAKNAREQGLLP